MRTRTAIRTMIAYRGCGAIPCSAGTTRRPICGSRKLHSRKGVKLDFTAESFNLFNRLNRRFRLTDDGAMSNAAQLQYGTQHVGNNYYLAYYQVPTNSSCVPQA